MTTPRRRDIGFVPLLFTLALPCLGGASGTAELPQKSAAMPVVPWGESTGATAGKLSAGVRKAIQQATSKESRRQPEAEGRDGIVNSFGIYTTRRGPESDSLRGSAAPGLPKIEVGLAGRAAWFVPAVTAMKLPETRPEPQSPLFPEASVVEPAVQRRGEAPANQVTEAREPVAPKSPVHWFPREISPAYAGSNAVPPGNADAALAGNSAAGLVSSAPAHTLPDAVVMSDAISAATVLPEAALSPEVSPSPRIDEASRLVDEYLRRGRTELSVKNSTIDRSRGTIDLPSGGESVAVPRFSQAPLDDRRSLAKALPARRGTWSGPAAESSRPELFQSRAASGKPVSPRPMVTGNGSASHVPFASVGGVGVSRIVSALESSRGRHGVLHRGPSVASPSKPLVIHVTNSSGDIAPDAVLTAAQFTAGNGFNKTGPGTLLVPREFALADSTPAFVNEGLLRVEGYLGETSVFVEPGGTLGGSGTVGDVVLAGGTLSPGSSPGILNTGDVTTTGGIIGTAINIEIGGYVPGVDHDQIRTTGTVTLNGGTLTVTLINGFLPAYHDTFEIWRNDDTDAILGSPGTFTGIPEAGIVPIHTTSGNEFLDTDYWVVGYSEGTGNDIYLIYAPEPGISAFAFLAAALLILPRRRPRA